MSRKGEMVKVNYEAKYSGAKVIAYCESRVTGGIAVWVRRHPDEKNWPWIISQFTTAKVNLTDITSIR